MPTGAGSTDPDAMKVSGVVQRVEVSGAVRTDVLDADGEQPVLDVLRSVIDEPVTVDDLLASNPGALPPPDDPAARVETMTWGQWRGLHPVTLLGGGAFDHGSGSTTVTVLAGPDSGYTLAIDPRQTLIGRVPSPDSLLVADPCLSRTPVRLRLAPAGLRTQSLFGSTVFLPDLDRDQLPEAPTGGALSTVGSDTIHVAPHAVEEPRAARPPQWWAFLIPIGIGVALALLTGMWWFLLFSLSAPLSGYIAHLVEKRRYARDVERHRLERAHAIDDASSRAFGLIAQRQRTARATPGLCLGFGAILSRITLAPEIEDRIDRFDDHAVVSDVPICIDPRSTTVVVTGERAHLLPMMLAWLADRRWAWAPSAEVQALPELVGALAEDEPATTATHSSERIGVDLRTEGTVSTLRLGAPQSKRTVSLVLGDLAQARTTTSTALEGPVPGRAFTATQMPPARFLTLVRAGRPSAGADSFPCHGLGELCDDDPERIATRWRQPHPGAVPVGRGPLGTVGIDLFGDGPHALVAGTTGSGKSMLLQSWLLSLALHHPPERLTLVLIDFKGGATFAPLSRLPHTDCVLDDFDSAAAFRALVSVRAEITRRERLLADRGCADILDLDDPPPRLVVVIDEFHALMTAHPRAADLLEHLAALGRSLGVHLILATQRPLGIVTGHMKANISIRICLRVRDDADSSDVIGVADAARLPPDRPGAALLDAGSALVRFRVAVPLTEEAPESAAQRPRLRPWQPGRAVQASAALTGIRIDNLLTAARWHTGDAPRSVVPPPLPTVDDLPSTTASAPSRPPVTGIVDLPAAQRQIEWSYDPAQDGSTIVITDDDPTAILVTLAESAAGTHRIVALGRIAEVIDEAAISCGMHAGWRLHAILDHLDRPPSSGSAGSARARPPTLVVCGNWGELIDSLDHHTAATLEGLLSHSRDLRLTFLLAGCRPGLRVSSQFRTHLIFPPSAGGDGLNVGLSRHRFLGTWPRLRAVLVGPHTAECGSDGADVQLLPSRSGAGPSAFSPRWRGLDEPGDAPQASPSRRGDGTIPLGNDAFGEPVSWDPARDGPVLTVRGSAQSGKTSLARTLSGGERAQLTIHDDAHREEPATLDLTGAGLHVVTMPLRFTPGYGSPLASAQTLGPTLILGGHTAQDLAALGFARLPPLDGTAGTGWFVTDSRARAIRVVESPPGGTAARSAFPAVETA